MKTRVMRLNETEAEIIELIRNIGADLVLSDLNNCYNDSPQKEQYFILKRMIAILGAKKIFDMDALISTGFITKEQSDYIIKSMKENKNIVITGDNGSGKSTLLNALLEYQKDVQFIIYERIRELNLSDDVLSNDTVICQEADSISMKDIVMLNDKTRLVMGEITASDDGLGLVGALKMGCSVLTTMCCTENCYEYFLSLFSQNTKQYAKEMFNKTRFIHVKLDYDVVTGSRKVAKIQEF